MTKFNGYRASKAAGGGLYNGYSTPKAKQDWSIGSAVNVGFLRGLTVLAKQGRAYRLQSTNGKLYDFEPHVGLSAV